MKKNKLFTETFSYKKLAKKNIRESLNEVAGDLRPEDRLKHLKDLYDMEPGDLTPAELKELKDAGMLEEAVVNSSSEAKVFGIIEQLKKMDPTYFYVALMIYEVLGLEHPSEALIKAVKEYIDDLDTVYDTYVRGELEALAGELEGALETSKIAKEEPVEERLGEFKKGKKLDKKKHEASSDFGYSK